MHIPNALLDPRVALAANVIGAGGLVFGLRALERKHRERTTVLMGTMAAFVFAAQMLNFPVGPYVTGHLLGGTLAAVMLGPWAGSVVIAAVLIVQCFLFGDGGLTALGANFVNMGLIGSVFGYAIYAPLRRLIGGDRGVIIGGMAAAWFSVLLAAGAFSIELSILGGRRDFLRVLEWMALVHAGIGIGEALITGMVLRFILMTRPDLIYEPESSADDSGTHRMLGGFQVAAAGLGIALAAAIFLGPFAWDAPDGLEFVGSRLNFLGAEAPPAIPSPLLDYEFPGLVRHSPRLATAAAGAIGTVVVFGFGLTLASVFSRRGVSLPAPPVPRKVSPDAA